MTRRPLKLVILGLSITSSWGNGHATTYRALVRGLAARGHDIVRAVVDRRGARGRHVALAWDVAATARRFRPDVVYAHFLVPAGLLATLVDEAGRVAVVPLALLPPEARLNQVVDVDFRIDEDSSTARCARIQRLQRRLFQRRGEQE